MRIVTYQRRRRKLPAYLSPGGDSARPVFVGHIGARISLFARHSMRIIAMADRVSDRADGYADELPGPASERSPGSEVCVPRG